MSKRILALTAALASLGAAGSASATTIKLSMNAELDKTIMPITTLSDGTKGYGVWFPAPKVQVYDAIVTDDAGAPVEQSCLAEGARIVLLDSAQTERGGATCTNSSGKWQFVLSGTRLTKPDQLTAQLLGATTTRDGRALSPASSNGVVLVMAARITNTMPESNTGRYFPLSGYVTMPAKLRALGTVRFEKKSGGKWVLVAAKKTDSSGKFKFTATYGTKGATSTFRYRFVPPKGSGWITSTEGFTITWV